MTTQTDPVATAIEPLDGRGPGGMWWVAWRQHRRMVLATGVATLILIGVMVAFRITFESWLRGAAGPGYEACRTEGNCDIAVYDVIFDRYRWWERLQAVMVAVPALVGVLVGVAVFTTDMDHRTVVFASTQSVSRLRWFVSKTTLVAVPAMAIMTVVGFVMQWTDDVYPHIPGRPFQLPDFATHGAAPAVLTLVGLSIGVMVAIGVRGTLAGLGVAALLTALCLAGLAAVHPHLFTPLREIAPVGGTVTWSWPAQDSWSLGAGYLGVDGREIDFRGCSFDGDLTTEEMDAAYVRCQTDAGIVSLYQDYLPADRLGPLRAVMATLCAGLSALFLAAGAFVLRRRAL